MSSVSKDTTLHESQMKSNLYTAWETSKCPVYLVRALCSQNNASAISDFYLIVHRMIFCLSSCLNGQYYCLLVLSFQDDSQQRSTHLSCHSGSANESSRRGNCRYRKRYNTDRRPCMLLEPAVHGALLEMRSTTPMNSLLRSGLRTVRNYSQRIAHQCLDRVVHETYRTTLLLFLMLIYIRLFSWCLDPLPFLFENYAGGVS